MKIVVGQSSFDKLPDNRNSNPTPRTKLKMNRINTFTVGGIDIDVLFQNGFLGYTFEFGGKPYGNKVKVKSKSVFDIASATILLVENALATHKKLQDENK